MSDKETMKTTWEKIKEINPLKIMAAFVSGALFIESLLFHFAPDIPLCTVDSSTKPGLLLMCFAVSIALLVISAFAKKEVDQTD